VQREAVDPSYRALAQFRQFIEHPVYDNPLLSVDPKWSGV